jgi:hypothetical protein
MPPYRYPLGLRDTNRLPGGQISLLERVYAMGIAYKGAKSTEIENVLDLSRGAIRSTLTKTRLRE